MLTCTPMYGFPPFDVLHQAMLEFLMLAQKNEPKEGAVTAKGLGIQERISDEEICEQYGFPPEMLR